jgi:hypothetical protein
MIVITVVWSMTHWTTWLLWHLSGVVLMSGAILSAGAPWYFFGGMWVLAVVHLGLYIWYHLAKARRGYRGRVVYS